MSSTQMKYTLKYAFYGDSDITDKMKLVPLQSGLIKVRDVLDDDIFEKDKLLRMEWELPDEECKSNLIIMSTRLGLQYGCENYFEATYRDLNDYLLYVPTSPENFFQINHETGKVMEVNMDTSC